MFLHSDIGEISGQANLSLQIHDGLVKTDDPNNPPLGTQRHEKPLRDGVPPGKKKQLTQVIVTNRSVEETRRSVLGRFGLFPDRLRICKYILYMNIARNTPTVRDRGSG